MSDLLSLVVGGRSLTGWTNVRFTRGIERCPADWQLAMTESEPWNTSKVIVQVGDPCQVRIGEDLVATGFIDRYQPSITSSAHEIKVVARGKCQDLVDCSAEWTQTEFMNMNAFQMAQKLVLPYQQDTGGIKVVCTVQRLPIVPLFNLMLGETAFEIIERVARYSSLLVYDTPDGNLLLTRVNEDEVHASGFEEGMNVQEASADISIDQRFSEYKCFLQSIDLFQDIGKGGNLISTSFDKSVPRHRQKVVIAESPGSKQGINVAKQRADWEMGRRYGRSFVINVTVDSWRDKAGKLWTPNKLAPINLPSLKLGRANTQGIKWTISQVTYNLAENTGTTANVKLMPSSAFRVLPAIITPVWGDIEAGAAFRVPP